MASWLTIVALFDFRVLRCSSCFLSRRFNLMLLLPRRALHLCAEEGTAASRCCARVLRAAGVVRDSRTGSPYETTVADDALGKLPHHVRQRTPQAHAQAPQQCPWVFSVQHSDGRALGPHIWRAQRMHQGTTGIRTAVHHVVPAYQVRAVVAGLAHISGPPDDQHRDHALGVDSTATTATTASKARIEPHSIRTHPDWPECDHEPSIFLDA